MENALADYKPEIYVKSSYSRSCDRIMCFNYWTDNWFKHMDYQITDEFSSSEEFFANICYSFLHICSSDQQLRW